MHTEEKAAEIFCPLYCVSYWLTPDKANADKVQLTCDASDCMMWRWDTSITGKESVDRGEPRKGYCGIGGKP